MDFARQAHGSSPAAQQCSLVKHLKAFREALVDQLLEYVLGDVEFDLHAIVVVVDPVRLCPAEFFGENELELVHVRVPTERHAPLRVGDLSRGQIEQFENLSLNELVGFVGRLRRVQTVEALGDQLALLPLGIRHLPNVRRVDLVQELSAQFEDHAAVSMAIASSICVVGICAMGRR